MNNHDNEEELIKKKAYYLWLKDKTVNKHNPDFYWYKAKEELNFERLFILYRWYIKFEKLILEPFLKLLEEQAIFKILGILGNITIVIGLILFILGETERYNKNIKEDWEILTNTNDELKKANFIMVQSAERLNSKPLKFPWLGITRYDQIEWTEDFWMTEIVENIDAILEEIGLDSKFIDIKETRKCIKGIKILHQIGNRRERQKFTSFKLNGISLGGVRLCNANFAQADLSKANLTSSKLNGSYFFEATLKKSLIQFANLSETEFRQANLTEANLRETNLTEANLIRANLTEANLTEADLTGADLTEANLTKAILHKAIYTNEQIKLACFWEKAIYKKNRLENKNYIKNLKKDKLSEPKTNPNCDIWTNS